MKTLLFFSASWCGSCKAIKPIVEKEAPGKGFEIKYYDLDTDEGAFAADDYGVRSLPTLIVIDSDGSELKRAVGNTAWKEVQ